LRGAVVRRVPQDRAAGAGEPPRRRPGVSRTVARARPSCWDRDPGPDRRTTMTSGTTAPTYDLEAWRAFRERREAELVEPYGWLTLQAFHWLPAEPGPLPGLPGTWSATATEARLEAEATDGL